ncbi:hypothetical protein [Streptomyces sp. NPDC093594]|uniref:hypothetical protein n=1 Tax=Streptomyces sp. NPDC093594 TaxID=3155305 RepID=UPI00344D8178
MYVRRGARIRYPRRVLPRAPLLEGTDDGVTVDPRVLGKVGFGEVFLVLLGDAEVVLCPQRPLIGARRHLARAEHRGPSEEVAHRLRLPFGSDGFGTDEFSIDGLQLGAAGIGVHSFDGHRAASTE